MSNPAIVLMTDPSRCSLGDVHHLVQALLEMRQMGEYATSQAFCDHPAAAKDFIAAYAHAYPQLVLEDREIPTPDHLESLIATGQIGALARPADLASLGGLPSFGGTSRPAEQNGANGFPIVVLTLGSAPVLIDALQQSAAMKESIRVIDIVPDQAANPPVSIAEAVAIHGLDGDGSWEHEGGDRPELDEIGGASTTDASSLALHDDRMSLDVVETAKPPSGAAMTSYQADEQEAGTVEASSAAAQPASAVATPLPAEPAPPEDSYQASVTAEPAPEVATPVATAWTDNTQPLEPGTQAAAPDELAAQEPDEVADPGGGEQEDQDKPAQSGKPDQGADDEQNAVSEEGGRDAPDDDNVYYPPVGSLIVGADVFYPALDQAAAPDQNGAYGALRELAAAMLDDGMVDPDLTGEMLAAQQGDLLPAPSHHEEIPTFRSSGNVVTIEDLYGSFDQDGDDPLADDAVAQPLHDSDL